MRVTGKRSRVSVSAVTFREKWNPRRIRSIFVMRKLSLKKKKKKKNATSLKRRARKCDAGFPGRPLTFPLVALAGRDRERHRYSRSSAENRISPRLRPDAAGISGEKLPPRLASLSSIFLKERRKVEFGVSNDCADRRTLTYHFAARAAPRHTY